MSKIREIMDQMDYGPAPEDSRAVRDWIATHPTVGHFINGAFVIAGETMPVIEPASDDVLAQLCMAGAPEVDAAMQAAKAAQGPWAALSGHARARYLYAISRHIQKRERFLAVLESIDNGKPIRESRDIDIPLVARHFLHHAGWAELCASEFPDHQPHGVCAQIIPWNFPLLMLAWKIAPALAAGNTVVLKPAENTPLGALAFAEICAEIGLPAGVVNIVQGDGTTGALVAGHDLADKVAFTGSTEVGRSIRRQIAGSGKALTLELGGKSPFIICADADLDAAVEGVVDAVWFNQGEVCCAGSRILVQEGVAARFTEKLRARMGQLRVGDPLDKCTDIGAIVSQKQLARIKGLLASGGQLHQPEIDLPERGSFCAPGFVTGTHPADDLNQTEIFGPIATLQSFRTPDEAIALANNSRYGLSASIWSETITTALDLAARVKAGVVWINATNLFDAAASFGGMRESGFGREGGRAGMLEYLRVSRAIGQLRPEPARMRPVAPQPVAGQGGIDVTAKLYIGGKQTRADGGASVTVQGASGQVALAGRKDVRNAVEAAGKAAGWASASAHNRAQVLYFLAENLAQRRDEFIGLLADAAEFDAAVARCFWYAAQADKFDGHTAATKASHLSLHLPEPFGIMGVIAPDEAPLLGLLSVILPAIAMGNRVVAVASQSAPLAATRLYQVFETSDIPAGVINLLTGPRDDLAAALASHDDVAALWYFGGSEGCALVEQAAAGNLKPVWADMTLRDWCLEGQGPEFLRRATQIKTIWVPYGA